MQARYILSVFEKGVSTRLFATFKPGDKMALMGPTGVRTKIPTTASTLLIAGNALGAVQALAVGEAIKGTGHRLIYMGDGAHASQVELESVCDHIIWVNKPS